MLGGLRQGLVRHQWGLSLYIGRLVDASALRKRPVYNSTSLQHCNCPVRVTAWRSQYRGKVRLRMAVRATWVRYTSVYGILNVECAAMPRTAKVSMTNRSQAVRLPKEYQFAATE